MTPLIGIGATVAAAVIPLALLFSFRFATRKLEARVLSDAPGLKRQTTSAAAVLGTLAALQALATCLGFAQTLFGRAPSGALFALGAVGICLQSAAFVIHQLPSHNRHMKYALLLLGAGLLGAALSTRSTNSFFVAAFALLPLAFVAVALAFSLKVLQPDRPLHPGDASCARAMLWYRRVTWIQGSDPQSLLAYGLLNFVGLGPAYLIVRYAAKARMANTPVVYLRSFRQESAGRTFGEIVVPAVHRSAAVAGLVHLTQSSGSLHAGVPLLWRTAFTAVRNDVWQSWVTERLDHALGVIIDVSESTESLRWEVEQANARLPSERVLLVRQGDPGDHATEGELTYSASAEGAASARAGMAEWLDQAMTAFASTLPPAPVTPARWQAPLIGLVLVFLSLPMAISGATSLLVVDGLTSAKAQSARVAADRVKSAAMLYMLDRHECPSLTDLEGRFLQARRAKDPWGRAFKIKCSGSNIEVTSRGPDGVFGTDDDVRR